MEEDTIIKNTESAGITSGLIRKNDDFEAIPEKFFEEFETLKSLISEPENFVESSQSSSDIEKYVGEYFNKNKINPTIKIAQTDFELTIKRNEILISHPIWSLEGSGSSLYLALKDMVNSANEIAPLYVKESIFNIDPKAFEFREFLLRLKSDGF